MAKIKLSEGFSIVPEGTHVFKITNVLYKEDFGKVEITMQTHNGHKHIERFSLLRNDGTPNDGAIGAFSFFARTALNDMSLDEIDPVSLAGHFIECDITHETYEKKTGGIGTSSRIVGKRVATDWGESNTGNTPKAKSSPVVSQSAKDGKLDLNAILG